ncbi:MAG: hypothetical protein HFF02_07895 [Erysipelotrichaceae bacterium]|nr:hypothetical protein [Erysipelotrichaceae bacterium]
MVKSVIIFSQYDMQYLFDNDNDYMVTYIEDYRLIISALHINYPNIIILDTRMFDKNVEIFRVYELLKRLNSTSEIYIMVDDENVSLLYLTDYMIQQQGFTNFLSVNDYDLLDNLIQNINIDTYKIYVDEEAGRKFNRKRIRKKNKQMLEIIKQRFYQKNVGLTMMKYRVYKIFKIVLILVVIIAILSFLGYILYVGSYFQKII